MWFYSVSPGELLDSILKQATIATPSISFPMNKSLLILPFDGIYSELLTVSHLPLPHHEIVEKKRTLKQNEGNITDIYSALF
jgi:hypothetical protein